MARRPLKRSGPLDIFADENLSRAQSALSDATAPPETWESRRQEPLRQEAKKHQPEPIRSAPPIRAAEEQPPAAGATSPVAVEPTNVHLKFRVRQATRARFDAFRAELSAALGGARLTDSNIGRALMDWILFELGDEILAAAKEASGTLRRPPADDPAAMAEFDEALREIVRAGAARRRGQTRKLT
jgi:hypothetical protein